MIGKTLAHYEILEKIGAGGMGEVYRARDTKLGRDVAVKVLPEDLALDPERRKRFEREAKAVAVLKHPNIVTIHSVEEVEDTHFITMELVEGKTLADVIPKNGLALDRFFDLAIPLSDAIGSAHAQGITHRDLKPANVMVDSEGRVKILDFGLAKLLEPSPSPEGATVVGEGSATQEGRVLGTAAYMSPEQAEGKPVDHRSDIFSLGTILYEMATGERPFKGDTSMSTLSAVLKDTPPVVTELRGSLPRHLGRIVARCLAKDPSRRYQIVADLRNDLEALKEETSTTGMAPGIATVSSAPVTKRSLLWSIVGVVVIATATAVLLLSRILRTEQPVGTDERTMLAVLPFENLGAPEDEYFADGITEEITSRLARLSGLGVISRTSATKYKNTEKSLRQIGEELGVQYILEGTIRYARSGGLERARVNPQLIRVADDTHVWTDSYDRVINDIFEVQSDIARKVINELGVTLLGSERERVEEQPTENLDAYKAYLQAIDVTAPTTEEWDRKTIELLERATRLDPGFLNAWYRLARHHASQYTLLDRTEARLSRAKEALQAAERVDPQHPMTRLARGYYYYYGFREYDRALEEFLAAAKDVPNDVETRLAIGYIHRRQGELEECAEDLKAGLQLDPQNEEAISNLAFTYLALRRFQDADVLYDRWIALKPRDDLAHCKKADCLIRWKGDIVAARKVMPTEPMANPFWYYREWFRFHIFEHDFASALEKVEELPGDMPLIATGRLAGIALAKTLIHGVGDAREASESAARACEEMLKVSPGNSEVRGWLAGLYALLGQHEAAVREAKLAVDLSAKDAFSGPIAQEVLAAVYALVGHEDEALDLVHRLLSMSYEEPMTVHTLCLDPKWDPLREHPRYQQLLEKHSKPK